MKKILLILIILFLVLTPFQKNVIGESLPIGVAGENDYPLIYPDQIQIPGQISLPEITEEQRQNLERLLKMPTGNMNDDIWMKITAQITCLLSINQTTNEAKMAEMVKPYGVTGEEYIAYHWQVITNPIKFESLFIDRSKEMEKMVAELKANNCQPNIKLSGENNDEENDENKDDMGEDNKKEEKEQEREIINPESKMTDNIWLEITARIKSIDRIALIFTSYEIGTIFEPFGVTPAEYQVYTESILKRMEEVFKKPIEEWTEEDRALVELSKKLKQRIEELKKKNCVLEDGTPISKEYNVPIEESKAWDKIKCKLFSCNNCYQVTEDSSWWAKYRCENLCKECPISLPPFPLIENCSGFCSRETCPVYADKISGQCAPQKKCHRCGPFNLFNCCEAVPSVCCLTRPPEVCQGFCGLENCPAGTVSAGQKNCPSQKKCRRRWIIFKHCETVPGVCCVSSE